jgi:hypothetical protein
MAGESEIECQRREGVGTRQLRKRSGQPSLHDVLVQRRAPEAPEYVREIRRRRAHSARDIDEDVIAHMRMHKLLRVANQPPSCSALDLRGEPPGQCGDAGGR